MDTLSTKLSSCLNKRKEDGRLIEPPLGSTRANTGDFASNDTLSLSSSLALSKAFLHELDCHPGFKIGSKSSRALDGTTDYLTDLEGTLADFHCAESALIFNSGFDANVAIWSTIPQPGDVVLFDEYVHASIHDGMRHGRARTRSFRHNDSTDLKRCLKEECERDERVVSGEQVVFVALESFYSMDGDVVLLEEISNALREMLPMKNAVLVIDEAHSNGLVGPNGAGMVSHYGLEGEFGMRLHTCGKALGSSGAVLLCNETIKAYLINYARNVIFSTAPTFVTLAGIRAGYGLLASEDGHKRRRDLEKNVQLFHRHLQGHPAWKKATKHGIVSVPAEETRLTGPFYSPIVALVTQPGQCNDLAQSIQRSGYWVNPVSYPIVPKELERVRINLHADNTEAEIHGVVQVIAEWILKRLPLEGAQ